MKETKNTRKRFGIEEIEEGDGRWKFRRGKRVVRVERQEDGTYLLFFADRGRRTQEKRLPPGTSKKGAFRRARKFVKPC